MCAYVCSYFFLKFSLSIPLLPKCWWTACNHHSPKQHFAFTIVIIVIRVYPVMTIIIIHHPHSSTSQMILSYAIPLFFLYEQQEWRKKLNRTNQIKKLHLQQHFFSWTHTTATKKKKWSLSSILSWVPILKSDF